MIFLYKIPLLLLLSLLLVMTINVSANEDIKPIRIVTLQDFKPFIWCDDDVANGIDVDIITELFTRVNRPFTIECLPWKRAMLYIQTGNADALFSAYKTPERENFATFLHLPNHTSIFNAFIRHDSPLIYQKIQDFYGKKIAISSGFSVNPEFDLAKSEGKFIISESKSIEIGIRMLLLGRVDIYINGKTAVLSKALEMGVSDKILTMAKPMHKPKPAYLIISKSANIENKNRLIGALDVSLNQMWQEGFIDHIVDSYTHVSHKN